MPDRPVRLSVLDQSPVPSGSTAAEALAATVELAQAAEALGYTRYWLAEHHGTPGLAGTAPEVLVARVAAATSTLRVGAGGVLLTHYSSLKVAEAFRVLHALFPGRIDLGIGRADGAGPDTVAALRPGPEAYGDEHFPRRVADLVSFLDGRFEEGHPYAGVRALPEIDGGPALWLLGSSPHSASLAGALGLSYCFAHFITPAFGPQVMARYRRDVGERVAATGSAVAVAVVCADTDEEAARLATSQAVWRVDDEDGRGPVPTVNEASAATARLDGVARARMAQDRGRVVIGGPERCRQELVSLAGAFGVDEVVVITVCHDPADRLRSYELLAGAFDLASSSDRGSRGDDRAR